MTATTTPNIADIIAKLQGHLATLSDGLAGRPLSEQAAFWRTSDAIQRTITGLKNAPDDRARAQARLDDLEARRAATVAKFAELETEIANLRDWRLVADARERDREYDRQRELRRALQRLEEGSLLRAPDVAFDRLSDLDLWIKEATNRRDRAQHALDAHLKTAEALLGAAVTG